MSSNRTSHECPLPHSTQQQSTLTIESDYAASSPSSSSLLPSSSSFLPSPISFPPTRPLPRSLFEDQAFDISAYSADQLLELCISTFVDAQCLHSCSSTGSSSDDSSSSSSYSISESSLSDFLRRVRSHYHRFNTYHGWTHGVHVLLNTFRYLQSVFHEYTALERFTLLLSAVCHDVDHCGQGNRWLLDHKAELAAGIAKHNTFAANWLERNTVERTIEILLGQRVNTFLDEGVGGRRPDHEILAQTTPHFLNDWKFSPKLQESFLHSFREFVLDTDIGDPERKKEIPSNFKKLLQAGGDDCCNHQNESSPSPTTGTTSGSDKKRHAENHQTEDHKRLKLSNSNHHSSSTAGQTGSENHSINSTSNSSSNFRIHEESHRHALSRIILLCADIGCVSEIFPITISWADRLYEELVLGRNSLNLAQLMKLDTRKEYREFTSRYFVEDENLLSHPSTSGSGASNGHDSAAASAAVSSSYASVASPTPSFAVPIVHCEELSNFYSGQSGFFSNYALPLFRVVAESTVLPIFQERYYPQLAKNIQYLNLTNAHKGFGEKIRIYLPSSSSAKEQPLVSDLEREFKLLQVFHHSLNQQQKDKRTQIQYLQFNSDSKDPTASTQPHSKHQFQDIMCASLPPSSFAPQ